MEHNAWPYVAGIFDSEGSVYIFSPVDKYNRESLRIEISQNDIRLGNWLVKNFGSTWYHKKNDFGGTCQWMLLQREAQNKFLNGMLPHLVAKKKQAKLALAYLDAVDKQERKAIANEIGFLNSQIENSPTTDTFDLSENKFPYVAGLIDGDGSISIYPAARGTYLNIQVHNTNPVLMRWLLASFGGKFFAKPRLDRPNNQLLYLWRISGKANKERFLLGVLPYLKLKRERGKIGLEYVRTPDGDTANKQKLLQRFRQQMDTDKKIQSELHGDVQSESAETPILEFPK